MTTGKELAELAWKMVTDYYGPSKYRYDDTFDNSHGANYNVGLWEGGYWHSDCLGFVHIAVNGFSGDRSKLGGGAVMDSFVWNSNEDMTLYGYCSTHGKYPKADLKPGALLKSSGHVGLYIGEHTRDGITYNSAECTLDGAKGWIPTWTDLATGDRYLRQGGVRLRTSWTDWGYFDVIDYTEPKTDTFPDVTSDQPGYEAIEWAAAQGIVKGFSDGTFRPDEPLTRRQMCIMLQRFAKTLE